MLHSKPKPSEIHYRRDKSYTVISLTAEATYNITSGREGGDEHYGLKILVFKHLKSKLSCVS